jgi:hypothetical protein
MTSQIACSKCGEPWSQYAMKHDVCEWPDEPDDAWERFASGEGCPCCDWGDKAGEVSRSRNEDQSDLHEEHMADLVFGGTDEDPAKFF